MKVEVKQIDGLAIAASANTGHWVTMDAPAELGGSGAGSRPMELILMGVAGCASMDILSILKKKKVILQDLTVEVEAEQAPDHPHVFTKITLNYTFTGKDLKATDIERAIKLTDEKYCPGTMMMKEIATVTHKYEIRESEE